jgi:hypothetical protein
MAELTDRKDLNKDTPAAPPHHDANEADASHRRMEREAGKLAQRARERQQKDEAGGEFHNIGPA